MPYVDVKSRERLDPEINALIGKFNINSSGEVNYAVTRILDALYSGRNYEAYNSAVGVLECVKLELYRRQISEYEDEKCKENGDVYH